SLPNLFPSVEPSLLLDIACHEFCPIDLCKLDLHFWSKADVECLESTAPHVGGLKEYPSFHSLLIPLHSYFAILQAFAASASDLHQLYNWSAVVQYHMEFHLHCHQEMSNGVYSGWAQPDNMLMTCYLFGCAR
ncbi:hypothetical protein BDZ94DRAFT_1146997, partial [Collybia nuda]